MPLLFCVRPFFPKGLLVTDTSPEIYDLMRRHAIPEGAVERLAGFSRGFLYQVRTGRRALSRPMEARARLAISRIRRGDAAPNGETAAAGYRLALSIVAAHAGVAVKIILDADPARRATADPAWLEAARVRRLALYVAHIYLGIAQAELARAANMSKAAVSIAMNDVEDLRGEPETERLLAAIEEAFG